MLLCFTHGIKFRCRLLSSSHIMQSTALYVNLNVMHKGFEASRRRTVAIEVPFAFAMQKETKTGRKPESISTICSEQLATKSSESQDLSTGKATTKSKLTWTFMAVKSWLSLLLTHSLECKAGSNPRAR
jgi:hypothetical protein